MSDHRYGPTSAGTVLLDLGAETGALVLYTPEDLAGAEIEISPETPGAVRTHAAVRARPAPSGTRYAAVYEGLTAGGYTIWRDRGTPVGHVTITGGKVTSSHWCGQGMPPAVSGLPPVRPGRTSGGQRAATGVARHATGRSAGQPEVDAGQRPPVGLGHVPDDALPQA